MTNDPLGPARGIVIATLIGIAVWAVVVYAIGEALK